MVIFPMSFLWISYDFPIDLKFQFQDRAQKQRLREVVPEGIGTVEREDKFTGSGDYAKKYLKYFFYKKKLLTIFFKNLTVKINIEFLVFFLCSLKILNI